MRWLYLSGNRLARVSPGALGPARELEKLHLDKNQLGEVPTEALEGLPALLELQLSGNPLGALRDGAFRPVGPSLQSSKKTTDHGSFSKNLSYKNSGL